MRNIALIAITIRRDASSSWMRAAASDSAAQQGIARFYSLVQDLQQKECWSRRVKQGHGKANWTVLSPSSKMK